MKPINTYVVPVLNNYTGLLALLESLEKYTPPNYQVIVINNGHVLPLTPLDEELIAKIKPKVSIWIDPYRNLGFAKSMNTGIKLATTEFVTIANDDVEVIYDQWWQDTMALFEKDPELMGFNPHSFINKAASGDRVQEYETKEEYTMEDIEKMRAFFPKYYVGCCTFFTIIKKKLFDEVGLFDESFGVGSGEDYDLMVRAGRLNYKIAGGSLVMVKHWWGATKDNMPKEVLNGISNYDLIVGGNQNMERKWGPHCDKIKDGWSVSGQGGPQEPFDKDQNIYHDKGKWYQIIPL